MITETLENDCSNNSCLLQLTEPPETDYAASSNSISAVNTSNSSTTLDNSLCRSRANRAWGLSCTSRPEAGDYGGVERSVKYQQLEGFALAAFQSLGPSNELQQGVRSLFWTVLA